MEISLNKTTLLKCLQVLEPIVTSRTALPIANDVLFQTQKNSCTVIGTDIETALKLEIDCRVTKSGEICLPAKKLLEAVRELPEEELLLKTKEETSLVAEMFCGKIKNVFVGQPAKNHPGMPPIDEKQLKNSFITISAEILYDALIKTVFATSKEETRYYLNGVYFNIQKDTAKFVATDGRRLAYVVRKLEKNKVNATGIVPTKAVNRIIEILEKLKPTSDIKFAVLQDHFVLEIGNNLFVSRLVQGEFPAYEQVIPKISSSLTVSSEKLLKGIKQSWWVVPEKGWGIKFLFTKNGLKLSSVVESVGISEVEVEIDYDGKDVEVKFEPEFITDMLSVLKEDDEVTIGINEPTSPWTFQPKSDKDYLYLVMPMKL